MKTLLSDVSFHLYSGEVLTIVGPSGAGKSTLLRLLNRLDESSQGSVLLEGVDTRTITPRLLRQRIGMVMQLPYLFPGSVASNISFGPAQAGKHISSEEISSLLDQVGLPGYDGRDVRTLSGGEAQRVSITRALANNPEILLLDEPTSALDEAAKYEVEQLLEELIHTRSLTCVWITHDLAQARRTGDRVLVLKDGLVKNFGLIEEILHD